MIVREFITKLGFKVDTAKIAAFDHKLGQTREKLRAMTGNMQDVARSARNTGLVLTATVTLPLTLLGIKALKTASDLEQMDVAFTTMLGSADKARKLIKDLLEFTAKTPFEIREVQQNAKLLLGMGIEAEKVIPTLNALGNVASGLSVPLERIALNYGQVRTQTRLTGAELRDFSRAGVPLIAELAKQLNTTEANVKSMVSKGAVSFAMVEKAFMDMSSEGGKFYDLMQKQSRTLAGRWSNLMDIVTIFGAEFGNMVDEAFNLRANIEKLTLFIERLTVKFKNMSPWQRKLIVFLTVAVAVIPVLITLLGTLALAVFAVTSAIAVLEAVSAPVLLPILAVIAAVIAQLAILGTAIYVIIDDFLTWKEGGDSVLGSLLGSFEDFTRRVRLMWDLLKGALGSLWEALTTGNEEAWEKFKRNMDLLGAHVGKVMDDVIARIEERFGPIEELLLKLYLKLAKAILLFPFKIIGFLFTVIKNALTFMFKEIEALLGGWLDKLSDKVGKAFVEKFPRLSKFLLTDEYIKGLGREGGVPPVTLPPGALATAGAGAAGGERNININSRVDLTVPEGTPEQQERFLQSSADAIFDKKLNDMLGMTLADNPQVEE